MKSLEELKAIRERMQGSLGLRMEDVNKTKVVVGMAECGIANGAKPVLIALSDAVQTRALNNVSVIQSDCIGLCRYEPVIEVFEPGKEKVTYIKMTVEKALEVLDKHILGGQIVTEYTLGSVE